MNKELYRQNFAKDINKGQAFLKDIC